jgi:NAD(P)-dependent dehydrogenase (short-subunit alcohol dehydrogenase family)
MKHLSQRLVLFVSSASVACALSMKRILVTGGNKGIGKAICQTLLAEHADVHVLLGSRDASRGEQAVADIVKTVGGDCKDRLEMVKLDTSSDASVQEAAASIASSGGKLYGIVNNAGIMNGSSQQEVVNTNYYGPTRVFDALSPYLQRPGGRVVNIASASGPNFVQSLRPDDKLYQKCSAPWTFAGFDEVDHFADTYVAANHYGFSKALVNAYSFLLARNEPDLIINSVTPGWILTDMTAGMGASNPTSKGAVPPVWLLMSPELETVPTGRYYGSDCVRSPVNVYRGPGEAPFEGPDGLEMQKTSTLSQNK